MPAERDEWLEADGLGGFASGTVGGMRTRRYHALLLPSTTPPTGRVVLVNGLDAWVHTPAGNFPISTQVYSPDVLYPDGLRRVEAFETDPWPHWTYRLDDGSQLEHEIFVPSGFPAVILSWRARQQTQKTTLSVRPFFSGRDYHALHHENPAFRFEPEASGARLIWRPYEGVPGVVAVSNAAYTHRPEWYRNFLYSEERARGLDFTEDLAAPGIFRWDLSEGEAVLILAAELPASAALLADDRATAILERHRTTERRRRQYPSRLHRAADSYVVRRGEGKTVIAGYPWFTDWGRDTFIALRGLCIATGRLDEARQILIQWASAVSRGMLPNRFPDNGDTPEFNAVDASLWYIIAAHDYLRAAARQRALPAADEKTLQTAIEAILAGYAAGTRHGIHMDSDGLLAAGVSGLQLTWMDAKVGDWVVTPRIGKPVEVQALWLNALWIGSQFSKLWKPVFERGRRTFPKRFWNDAGGYLYDVVDVDHEAGAVDAAFRPNQIFAAGGLPAALLDGERARRVVDAVESRLWTPLGLRSLAPGEPGYTPHYAGGPRSRDGAYHQGTVWPWLVGPFAEAWIRVRGGSPDAKAEARKRFLRPLEKHIDRAGLGHVSEIADGDPPHTPRGCPFQAWSVGEMLRLSLVVLADHGDAGQALVY